MKVFVITCSTNLISGLNSSVLGVYDSLEKALTNVNDKIEGVMETLFDYERESWEEANDGEEWNRDQYIAGHRCGQAALWSFDTGDEYTVYDFSIEAHELE